MVKREKRNVKTKSRRKHSEGNYLLILRIYYVIVRVVPKKQHFNQVIFDAQVIIAQE